MSGRPDAAVIPLWLSDSRPERRCRAVEELQLDLDAAAEWATLLVTLAADEREQVRESAVGLLERLPAPRDPRVLLELRRQLQDRRENVAYWAVTLLARAADPQAATPLAVVMEGHADASVRQRAAWALGRLGAAAHSAIEPLRNASRSDDVRLARLAELALSKLTRDDA